MSQETQSIHPYFYIKPFSSDRLFCDLSQNAANALARLKHLTRVSQGKVIFAVGDVYDVCILCEGQAQLKFDAALFREDSVRLAIQNEAFGTTEAFAGSTYKMTLKTVTPCVIETIGREKFADLLAAEPEICDRFLRLLALDFQAQGRMLFSKTD